MSIQAKFAAVAAALCATPAVAQAPDAGCAPQGLVHVVVRNVTPGLAPTDPTAQPREIWRQGSAFLRSVEAAPGGQRMIIVSEPNIWLVDTAKGEARHAVDPGPTLAVHAPVLPVEGTPGPLLRLEFGCEAQFVAAYAPRAERQVDVGGLQAGLHTVTVGDHAVAILMDEARQAPVSVAYLRAGQPNFVVRYDVYERNLLANPQLFAPPKGVEIVGGPTAQTSD
jgi:hypothetical protein